MIRTLILLLAGVGAFAQEAPGTIRKVVNVTHISGDRAERAVKLIAAYMHPVGTINFDASLKTAVLTGPEKVVEGAEALLTKFDSPGALRPDRQVELRVHLVEGSPDPAASSEIPADISGAVEQMKKSFIYRSYKLVDVIPLRSGASNRPGQAQGMLPGTTRRLRSTYDLSFRSADPLEDGKTVAIRQFSFSLRVPVLDAAGNETYAGSSISADLTILEGQKLVVGKLPSENVQNAIFLILTVDVQ